MIYVKPDDWQPSPGIRVEGKALEIVKSKISISVLADPGSGKTELLAQRATYLLTTGICPPPRRILAIAFKVDAAMNLQNRVSNRCGPVQASRFDSLTLDAFAKKIVDQFLESLPEKWRPNPNYRIFFGNNDIWEEFWNRCVDIYLLGRKPENSRIDDIVHRSMPDFELGDAKTQEQQIRRLWWREQIDADPSRLTFDMIKLLATYILQSQDKILSALRQTYSHVFLDEFQDVTVLQYELVKAAFLGSNSVLTAVGDSNQAIMRWAGARADIFNQFEADFRAPSQRLLFNYRSNARIVALINDLAATFDGDYAPTECARQDTPIPNNAVEVWEFDTRQAEGEYLATYVAEELQRNSDLTPSDFVILAKLKVNGVEDRIKAAFRDKGLKIRNEARTVSGIAIQDLVKEKAYVFLLASLKLAVNVRDGLPFQDCRNTIADIHGADLNSDKGHSESLRAVKKLIDGLKLLINGRSPSEITGKELSGLMLKHVRPCELQRRYREYIGGERLTSSISGFVAFFDECRDVSETWSDCIANMEGSDSVRLMTIHKSKGLEYHTVIFVEFNDDAFWAKDDDKNVFFVALSRARERVYFSFSKDSKGRENVIDLYNKLKASKVPFLEKK